MSYRDLNVSSINNEIYINTLFFLVLTPCKLVVDTNASEEHAVSILMVKTVCLSEILVSAYECACR
jgi:hypothetical protein